MKIAIVTGGSRGLGRNIALSIARHGSDVIITYQSRGEDAKGVVAEIEAMGHKAIGFQLDTGYVAAFPPVVESLRKALLETWKRETFGHLVNNAGHGDYAPIEQTTEVQFDKLVNVHFKGVPDDIGPMIADLLSENNRWVNAQRIEVSGGQGI
jgi:NAD(P)-dependent dehydrogenase (short-subunit alcohol dehydrogenase family)